MLGLLKNKREINPIHSGSFRFTFVIGLICFLLYGYEMFNFTLSIDEELYTYHLATWKTWLSQGRWGMAVLSYLMPPISGLPFISTLIFCVGLVGSTVLLAPLITENDSEKLFFGMFFVAFPIWPHLAEFNSLSWGIGIGLCIISLATQLMLSFRLLHQLLSIICVAFGAAIYQSLMVFFIVTVLLVSLNYHRKLKLDSTQNVNIEKDLLYLLAKGFIITALGIGLYITFSYTLLYINNMSVEYIDHFVKIKEFTQSIGIAYTATVTRLFGLIVGTDNIYLEWGKFIWLLPSFGLIVLIIQLVRNDKYSYYVKLIMLLIVFLAIFVAFSPVIISAGIIPARALIALPLVFSYFSMHSLLLRCGKCWFQWVIGLYFLIIFIWISNALFYSDEIARQRDKLIAGLLFQQIESIGRPLLGKDLPFTIIGNYEYDKDGPLKPVEIFGTSFFHGNVYRMALYLKLMGIKGLKAVSVNQMIGYEEQIINMPHWPLPGSVSVVNNVLVIKFSEINYNQQDFVCKAYPNSLFCRKF